MYLIYSLKVLSLIFQYRKKLPVSFNLNKVDRDLFSYKFVFLLEFKNLLLTVKNLLPICIPIYATSSIL